MKKRLLLRILYIILIIGIMAFIFSNSFVSKDDSADNSGRILSLLNGILEALHSPFLLTEFFVRKAAHFAEFFLLGTAFFGYISSFYTPNFTNTLSCAFLSCLTAMTDETIQYFTGRGSMLLDVWLDFTAAVTAIIIFGLIYRIKQKKLNHK